MLGTIADIRRGELSRAALAFAVLLLVVASYTIIKAVRDAVLLSRFSVTELSLVSIGLAFVSGAVVSVYLRSTSGIPSNRLVVGTHLVVALSLLLLAAGLRGDAAGGWLPWLLYAWSSVFGVFVIAQFWLLASDLFDLREAKRLFGLVAWGGVAGGLSGGLVAQFLARRVGTLGLLVLSAALFALASLATHALWKLRRLEVRAPARRAPASTPSLWSLVQKPSYLRILAFGLILATTVTTLLDFELKTVAKHAFGSRSDDLAAFFGGVHAYLSAGSLALQLVVTPWLLHRYGVGVGRGVLPIALLLGFAALIGHGFFPVPLLAVVTGARLLEGGTRFAIHQPAVELSWLALPARERELGKPFVDTVGDRIGTALAGLIWIGFAVLSLTEPERLRWVAAVGMALVGGWLLLLARTQRAYVEETRAALAQRSMDLDSLRQSLGDEQTRHTIVDALESGDAGRIRFALYLLESWERPLPDLTAPLSHASSDVRVQTLRLLARKACVEQRPAALPALIEGVAEVREAAVVYLRTTAPTGRDEVLARVPEHDPEVRFARWLVQGADPSAVAACARNVTLAIEAAARDVRLSMLRLLAAASGELAALTLRTLLDHPDPDIVAASIRAAGRARAAALVPELASKLGARRWRAAAVSALADIGGEALQHLVGVLRAPETPGEVKRAIVRLAGASRDDRMAAELIALLDHESSDLADAALRSLVRLHSNMPIAVARRDVMARVIVEVSALAKDLCFLGAGAWPQARNCDHGGDFLRRSARDAVRTRMDRVFQLLALVHAPADVQSVQRGLKSSMKSTRAKSIELLDNLVDVEVRRVLVPVLEDGDPERFAAVAKRTFGAMPELRNQTITRMIRGKDAWLRQVGAWAAQPNEGKSMGLSLVEKALRLGTVDVLSRVSSEDLAYIAQLAEEIGLPSGTTIYGYGDAPDALYVVLSGTVRLYQDKEEIGELAAGEAFGSWALFDEAPRLASAITDGPVGVLKVDREEFLELLGDRVAIARAIFKAMVERIRNLAELAPQR